MEAPKFGALRQALLDSRSDELARIKVASAEAGGVQNLMQLRWPRLALASDTGCSDQAVLEQTEAWLDAADHRLSLCAECPPDGGACAQDRSPCLERGLKPELRDGRFTAPRCDRWREYVMQRRLIVAGVEARYAPSTLHKYAERFSDEQYTIAGEFVSRAAQEHDVWLVVQSPNEIALSEVTIALLRNVLRENFRSHICYAHSASLGRALKDYFSKSRDGGGDDPLSDLRTANVSVIDGLNPKIEPQWFKTEIRALLRDRWANKRSTLIGSLAPVKLTAHEYLTTLTEAACLSI